tara:strand:- start:1886 stop:2134 length:249 start_codon:yes stop_codon:yes gene_type:complete
MGLSRSLIPGWQGWHLMIPGERLILSSWKKFPGLPPSNGRAVRVGLVRAGVSGSGASGIMLAVPNLKGLKCIVSIWLKQFSI